MPDRAGPAVAGKQIRAAYFSKLPIRCANHDENALLMLFKRLDCMLETQPDMWETLKPLQENSFKLRLEKR